MKHRVFKFGLLAFQAWWLMVMLPGHTRGMLSFAKPGTEPSKHSCCEVPSDKTHAPTDEQKQRCAVCYYAVGLSTPPLIDIELPDLGLLEIQPLIVPIALVEQQHILTYYACGPPVFSV